MDGTTRGVTQEEIEAVLSDPDLSLAAKGLWMFIRTFGYKRKSVLEWNKNGQDSMYTALNELKQHGYIRAAKNRDGEGKFSPGANITHRKGTF